MWRPQRRREAPSWYLRSRRPHSALATALALFIAGCARGEATGSGGPAAAAGVGGLGKPVSQGRAADLRATPDGKYLTYLVNPEKPRLQGVPPQMLLGELHVVASAGGAPRKVGENVTNMPGGSLFTPDSRWALFLTGYNAANQDGTLTALDLTDSAAAPLSLGKA